MLVHFRNFFAISVYQLGSSFERIQSSTILFALFILGELSKTGHRPKQE